jgi:cytochrome oxidase Cu insertion factor (SCO1/SenC/PrrC family)
MRLPRLPRNGSSPGSSLAGFLPAQLVLVGACLVGVAGCGGGISEPVEDSRTVRTRAPVDGVAPAAVPDGGPSSPQIAASGLPTAAMEPAAPFQLVDSGGEAFGSTSLAGKVWLGSIFFANCPGTCFRENQAIADILAEIDDPDFVAVSITCDPENDTPEALARYAERFQADPARWKFLTGGMDQIKAVAGRTLFLPAEVGVHSERGVVFDRTGRLRGSYLLLQEDRVALLKKLVRELLAEEKTAPAPDASAGGQAR